jgi:hypothetical protein
MCPNRFAGGIQVNVTLFHQRGIFEVGAVNAPIVKLVRAGVWRAKDRQLRQPVRITERQGPQQQRVDHAEHADIRADADCQRKNRESRVDRAARPLPERVPAILPGLTGHMFIRHQASTGLVLIPQKRIGIGGAIENLLLLWEVLEAADLENRICLVPSLVIY